MNFDQWIRRPAYVAQCFTCQVARSLPEWCSEVSLKYRAKPEYRGADGVALRRAVAAKVIELRRSGAISRESIRKNHEKILVSRGVAVPIDLESFLRRGEVDA